MAEEKRSWFQRLRGKKAEPEAQPVADITAEQPEELTAEAPIEDVPVVADEPIVVEVPVEEPLPEPELEPVALQPEPEVAPEIEPDAEPALADANADTLDDEASTDNEPKAERNWFQRLRDGLRKSTSALSGGIGGIFTKAKLDDDTLEELEDLLITSDLGVAVAGKLTAALAKGRYNKEISGEEVKSVLAQEIEAMLEPVAKPLAVDHANKPHIILMAGVNGAGKTTTIGKLAKKFRAEGKSVMLAAGDTFRAAAVEQLQVWGDRNGVPVVTKEIGADAAALAYEAVDRAQKEGTDVLLIDTAGRLQNREELMAELAKVVRVIGKKVDGAPHDTVIVLDATTGQNAVHQVEVFQKLANISGIVMTKLDGSARGGVLVACAEKFGLPVHAIGVGEAIDDLQPFSARDFARALVGLER
ncbi:MAG: signal recognition particle-docking protein FtsY [Alphaproteobacteria bacterium]|nr:MAG: signal recognition particle-docking protein FtsY [Alphaproteobacteria bacterium]